MITAPFRWAGSKDDDPKIKKRNKYYDKQIKRLLRERRKWEK